MILAEKIMKLRKQQGWQNMERFPLQKMWQPVACMQYGAAYWRWLREKRNKLSYGAV